MVTITEITKGIPEDIGGHKSAVLVGWDSVNEVFYPVAVDSDGKILVDTEITLSGMIGIVGIDQTTPGSTNAVVRTTNALSNSGVLSADTAVKTSAGLVYWITVSDTAALAIELNDSPTGVGPDVWAIDLPAAGYGHCIFDPPIVCSGGIYLDVSTATCKCTLGYL